MNLKFRSRLFLFYLSGVCLTVLLLAAYFINIEADRFRRFTSDQLLIQAKLISLTVRDQLKPASREELRRIVRLAARDAGSRVTVVNRAGTVLDDSISNAAEMASHKDRPEIKAALSGKPGLSIRFSSTLRREMVYAANPIRAKAEIIGAVRLARSIHEQNRQLARLKGIVVFGVLATAVLALFSGLIVAGKITRPISELHRLATRLSQGDLGVRIRYFGRDELADLGVALNNMARQLSDSFNLLRDEKRKLEVILENLSDGILVVDAKLRIILANPTACAMLGTNFENLRNRPFLEAVLNHRLWELIQEAYHSQQALEAELTWYYPEKRQFLVSLAPLKDEAVTGPAGLIVDLRDLTPLRRLERVRRDFVANVSHELRTPVTTVKAMTETLLGGAWRDGEMLSRYLRAIDQESDRLANLINDLLALAKLDSKTAVTAEPFDLAELIREVKERFVPSAGTAPSFTVDLSGEELPLVHGNRDQIKQVLINLLDNAFKYTPAEGRVSLTVRRDGAMVKVSVADTGIGIPNDELGRIFERFYRVDKARSREMGGTGLGLSIVKHIVESHGGEVKVESSLNHGSIFSFTIPAAAVTPSTNS